jgi:hypothetical protein
LKAWPDSLRRADLVDTEGAQEMPEDQGWTDITLGENHRAWFGLVRFLRAPAERVIEDRDRDTRSWFAAVTEWEVLGPSDPMWLKSALEVLARVRVVRLHAPSLALSPWVNDDDATGEALGAPDLPPLEALDFGGLRVGSETGRRLSAGALAASILALDVRSGLKPPLASHEWLMNWPSTLQRLGLGHNRLESKDALAFLETPVAQHLVALDLRHNRLDDRFARAIQRWRPQPTPMRRLYLHGNGISDGELANLGYWGRDIDGFVAALTETNPSLT